MNPLDSELSHRLSPRDLAILDDLERYRLLTTRHIQRLHFPVAVDRHATQAGATRATSRVLARLKALRLIAPLERRIGGARRGSQGFVWQLSAFGDRIQRSRRGERGRKRYREPALQFLDHTLAITDLVVELHLLEQARRIELLSVESEPSCWREFAGAHGGIVTLKPDLYAVTALSAWEDHWWIEADRSTEHVPTILAKCRTYASYAATGIEQERLGLFPAVLWVVPDMARKTKLHRAIRDDQSLPDSLFRVVTVEEFAEHLTTTD